MRLSERLIATKFRPSGFDFLRIFLAICVVVIHSTIVCCGLAAHIEFYQGPIGPFARLVVPSFFALSGFLVAGSLLRTRTTAMFLGLRIIRIFPALAVEVILSAFILGPLLSTLPWREYFSDPKFTLYLLNVVGHIHYELPGVFEHNPLPETVNGALWTVPFELDCYVALAAVVVLVGVKRRALILASGFAFLSAYLAFRFSRYGIHMPLLQTAMPGPMLVVTFIAGVSIYLYRDVLPWSRLLAGLSFVASLLCLSKFVPYGEYAAPFPIGYLTVYLGLTNFDRPKWLQHADYSYGVYLYGYVIQQTVVLLIPWARE